MVEVYIIDQPNQQQRKRQVRDDRPRMEMPVADPTRQSPPPSDDEAAAANNEGKRGVVVIDY